MNTLRFEFNVVFKNLNKVKNSGFEKSAYTGKILKKDYYYSMYMMYVNKINGYINALYDNKLITTSSKNRYLKILDKLDDHENIVSFRGWQKKRIE